MLTPAPLTVAGPMAAAAVVPFLWPELGAGTTGRLVLSPPAQCPLSRAQPQPGGFPD